MVDRCNGAASESKVCEVSIVVGVVPLLPWCRQNNSASSVLSESWIGGCPKRPNPKHVIL